MAIVGEGEQVREEEALAKEIEQIKKDSRTLSDSKHSRRDPIEFRNQFGRPVDIPAEERFALVSAMTLYETGRAKMKQQNFADALLFFLESDAEFR
jgi:hypothetical protein